MTASKAVALTAWRHPYMIAQHRLSRPARHFPSFRAVSNRIRMGGFMALGAGDGNRTRVACLEGRCSTIELHRRVCPGRRSYRAPGLPVFPGRQKQKEEDFVPGLPRVEPPARLELTTYGLQIRRSTSCSYEGIFSSVLLDITCTLLARSVQKACDNQKSYCSATTSLLDCNLLS